MEKCTRGYNWGVPALQGDTLRLSSAQNENSLLFELPLKSICEIQGSGREIAIGFADKSNAEGVTEIRFHVPPAAVFRGELASRLKPKKSKEDSSSDEDEEKASGDDESEEGQKNPAQVLLESLKEKCEQDTSGRAIAQLLDMQVLAPKARLDFDLFKTTMRVRGKKQSWMVTYADITQMFLLPAPDGVTRYLVLSLSKPLKQGQTPYYFLVLSFNENVLLGEEDPFRLTLTEEELNELNGKESGPKLSLQMTGPLFELVAKVLKVFSGAKVIGPSKFVSGTSKENLQVRSIACSLKAQPGSLFPLERSLIFLPKPCTYLRYDELKVVKFRNVGQRFFDVILVTRAAVMHELQSLDKSEYLPLVEWLKAKSVNLEGTKEEMYREQVAAMEDSSDDEEEDDDDFEGSVSSDSSANVDDEQDEQEDEDSKKKKKEKKHKEKKEDKDKEKHHKHHKHKHHKDKHKHKHKDKDKFSKHKSAGEDAGGKRAAEEKAESPAKAARTE
eukprot:RCo012645